MRQAPERAAPLPAVLVEGGELDCERAVQAGGDVVVQGAEVLPPERAGEVAVERAVVEVAHRIPSVVDVDSRLGEGGERPLSGGCEDAANRRLGGPHGVWSPLAGVRPALPDC